MKMQVFSRNFSIYSFLYGIYSCRVFHLPLRERKKPPRLPLSETEAVHYALFVLSQALTRLLAGVLDRSLSGCQNYRAFESIHLHSPCLLEGFSIVDMVMAVILHSEFNIFRKCCPRNRSISQMHHNSHSSQIVIPKFLINSIIGIQFQTHIHRIARCE